MLEFKSAGGNTYAWDEISGLLIPFTQTMNAVEKELFTANSPSREQVLKKLRSFFNEEEIAFCYDWLKKWGRVRPNVDDVHIDLSRRDPLRIKTFLLRSGLTQLTLGVTHDCNLGCKYCSYRDCYEYSNRTQSKKYMSFAVAKKAIDYYFSLLVEGRRYNPLRKPCVSFYGGEPLLNIKLIKKCVKYIKDAYNTFETKYKMTTNGTLLDEDTVDWLIQNNFSLAISLDGPEDEHNRNRIYRDGKGSFRDVMKNVIKLMNRGKDVSVVSVFDYKSNLSKLDEFFSRQEIPGLAAISPVNNIPGCTFFNQYSEEDRNAFWKKYEDAKAGYFENFGYRKQHRVKNSVLDHLFCTEPMASLFSINPIRSPPELMPLTSACIPGYKIFVDVEGAFHACERVNETYPLGNVDEGLNFEVISEFLYDYLRHMDKCGICAMRRACGRCYAHFLTKGEFIYSSDGCKEPERDWKDHFSMAFTIGEIDPKSIDEKS